MTTSCVSVSCVCFGSGEGGSALIRQNIYFSLALRLSPSLSPSSQPLPLPLCVPISLHFPHTGNRGSGLEWSGVEWSGDGRLGSVAVASSGGETEMAGLGWVCVLSVPVNTRPCRGGGDYIAQ